MKRLFESADEAPARNVWITRLSLEQIMSHVNALEARSRQEMPLYGIPFVIKDNIDLAGVPTTAGCPAFAYTPQRSARVVQKLLDAGAIPLGKTNLDQFATGLVGVRSPYGACRNSFDAAFISGGSSAGFFRSPSRRDSRAFRSAPTPRDPAGCPPPSTTSSG